VLTADYLDVLPNSMVRLYSEYELSIIKDIARRLSKLDFATAAWQVQRLSEAGGLYKDIIKKISRLTGISQQELRRLFKAAGVRTMKFDDAVYIKAGLKPIPLNMSPAMAQVLAAGLEKTNGILYNLTMTTANTAQAAFIRAADLAYYQVSTGAMSYTEAINAAIKSISSEGIKMINYETGKADQIDVAVRRTVLTGVAQTAGKLQMKRADEMGIDLLETSAHAGARNRGEVPENHELWQGRVFTRGLDPANKDYPNFYEVTGYGTATGLMGINCRHSFYSFFKGISERAYTDQQLKELNKTVTYNGQELSQYEASQVQRGIERKIRYWKRQAGALEAAGLDATKENAKVKQWQARMRDFTKQTGLDRERERERVIGATIPELIQEAVPVVIPEPVVETNYNDTAEKAERDIFKLNHERAVVIDQKGNIILEKTGTDNMVIFTDNEFAQMKGKTLIHNHPAGWSFDKTDPRHWGNSFSPEDIKIAAELNVPEIRVVTPRYIFYMKPGESGWPGKNILNSMIRKYNDDVRTMLFGKINKNLISTKDAEAAHWHLVNTKLAEFFKLKYDFIEHGWE
jgi:hypothetical protein